MTSDQQFSDFFTAGGTLPPNAPSYVTRPTDDELFQHILAGEFCYVLTPRQMGKSSLMIRTAQRLLDEGIRSAIVDLTQIGTVEGEDTWYKGILTQIKRRLKLKIDPVDWWEKRKDIPNIQKFIEFFEEALAETKDRIVIFVDEIDTTLKLDFRDNFFAGIRAFFNARAENPAFERLTFVLLGVASPSDLIKDRSRTPFNIGQEIQLKSFSRNDAKLLEKGIESVYPGYGKKILDRIFHWTNGHPYLTQKLCQTIVENRLEKYGDSEIDSLIERLFSSEEASRETNLQFVRDNILNYPKKTVLLSLYKKLLRNERIREDKNSVVQNQLKLSGLAKVDDGFLVLSNRIYREVFDLNWIKSNSEVNRSPYIYTTLSFIIISLILVLYYDGRVLPGRANDDIQNITVFSKDERGIQSLADIFRISPIFLNNEYEYKGKNHYFNNSTWEQQKDLLAIEYGEPTPIPEDFILVAKMIYISFADVDRSGDTTPLLKIMQESLTKIGLKDDGLYQEITYWMEGRELSGFNATDGDLENALNKYDAAIEINSQNPATLFERARIYTRLGEYENALKDYDQVVGIVPNSSEPTPNPNLTETPIATQTITVLPTKRATTASVTLIPLNLTATPIITAKTSDPLLNLTFSPTISPIVLGTPSRTPTATLTPTPTFTLTPSLTPTPTATFRPVQPKFITFEQRKLAVKNDLDQNIDLSLFLLRANKSDYPHLDENLLLPSDNLLTNQPTKTPTSTKTLTPSPTATITSTPPMPVSRVYNSASVLVFDNKLVLRDKNLILENNKPCWQTETSLTNLTVNDGFFQRDVDKYWGFGILENEDTALEERPVGEPIYVNFSSCPDINQVNAMGLNAWILKLVPERVNPAYAPSITDPGREFGFFVEGKNGTSREYTLWIDAEKVLHLKVRENGKVIDDNSELVVSTIQTDGAFPRTYHKFFVQIFLELNNNGTDAIYLLQGSDKPITADKLNPTNMILKSTLPTIGELQKIGLVGYGGETQVLIWPLVFYRDFTESISVPQPCVAPETPVLNGSQSNGNVFISWNEVSDVPTYQVFRSLDGTNYSLLEEVPGTATIDTIPNNSTYFYYVIASNLCGSSEASNTVKITGDSVNVSATLTATPLGYGKALLFVFPLETPNGKRISHNLIPNQVIVLLEKSDDPGGPWYRCQWTDNDGTSYEGWIPASVVQIVPGP